MDVLSNVFMAACLALDIESIGCIAVAFLSTKMEVFRDVFQCTSDFGLSSLQVALGEDVGFPGEKGAKLYGDIHTAVSLYLKWKSGPFSCCAAVTPHGVFEENVLRSPIALLLTPRKVSWLCHTGGPH
jgi:hypothetical protein